MATKRLTLKTIEWAKLAERVPPNDKAIFLAFKGKSDGYLRRLLSNPENPPKLDWELYKKMVPVPGMVDSFQKQYESLEIPYPKDTASAQIDSQEQELKKQVAQFKDESNQRIQSYKEELIQINSLIPYEQMTLEEFIEVQDESEKFDMVNKPAFWPYDSPDEENAVQEEKSSH